MTLLGSVPLKKVQGKGLQLLAGSGQIDPFKGTGSLRLHFLK